MEAYTSNFGLITHSLTHSLTDLIQGSGEDLKPSGQHHHPVVLSDWQGYEKQYTNIQTMYTKINVHKLLHQKKI